MEKNTHNDGLEDFLRKSFDQYDDSPSDRLWDRIEADLQPPKVVPMRSKRPWLAWAAAAMFTALLIGQHFYFQKEKTALTNVIKQQSEKIAELEKQLKNFQESDKNSSTSDQNHYTQHLTEKTTNHSISTPSTKENNTANAATDSRASTKTHQGTPAENGRTTVNLTAQTVVDEGQTPSIPPVQDSRNEAVVPQQQAPQAPLPTPGFLENLALDLFPTPVANLDLPEPTAGPTKHASNISVGAHHALFFAREKMTRVIQRPHGGPSRTFNNTKAMTGTSQMTALNLTRTTKSNWEFGAAAAYRTADLSSRHEAKFRFQDRRPNGNNPRHEFAYSLNTPSGLLDIEVRADQTDPNETINELEDITIEVKTRQTTSHISIPVWAGKKMATGNGRLGVHAHAGLLTNFLLNQSLEVSGNVATPRLRSDRTAFSRRNGQGPRRITLDFMVSTGLSQRIGRHWEVRVSPSLIVPLSSRHNDPYIKSSGLSTGVDVGLGFHF